MEILKLEAFNFTYPTEESKTLSDISFTVNSGEFITLCGKSGCGKSTLLKSIKPAIAPHGIKSGKIFFSGIETDNMDLRSISEGIGFVSQSPDNQIVCDKVWHELAFGLESLGMTTKEIRLRVSEMASFFGIQNWFHSKTTELSGGQKQLLNLASVMVMQPKLLLLDEPTSQLDPIAAQEFLAALSKINRELGTTILLSEHRLEETFTYSSRVIVMENGKISADAKPSEIGAVLMKSNNDMFSAMPAPIQIFVGKTDICPVTVRESRDLLEEVIKKCENIPEIVFEKESEANTENAAIELDEVWFRYGKNLPDIIKGISAIIYQGEFFALLGGNGTGKSTLLSVIAGAFKPHRGKIKINKKAVMLPQNPQTLFVKKTVELDLYEMLSGFKFTQQEKDEKIREISKLCEIESLLQKHPYDISGGEQQRAALAKVLLLKPEILLLDEPTKGLDAQFKEKLSKILCELKKSGVTIVMVSHDIEFCAKYADRCGMFFDGCIISDSTPREFFTDKSFYTTAACRISRGIIKNAVLTEDIIKVLNQSEVN